MKYHKGKYKLKNPEKYKGDPNNVVYRSGWERSAFIFLDKNQDIIEWASEEIVIPYTCATDGKRHRYFIDVYYKTKTGHKYLIEIKPHKQTLPPTAPNRRTKRYITEALTYAKNQSKWKAAQEFALDNSCTFDIWTEHKMKALGIKII